MVSLETAISQQVHQPIAELLLADSRSDSLGALAGAVPQLSAPERANCDAEASQMEMSPASTGGERGGAVLDSVREGRLTSKVCVVYIVFNVSKFVTHTVKSCVFSVCVTVFALSVKFSPSHLPVMKEMIIMSCYLTQTVAIPQPL